jgi:hypothetical protein
MKQLLVIFFILAMPLIALSQYSRHSKANKNTPVWAATHHYDASSHVYFPDYYTFYDAKRKGYVYWENGSYKFTPALPPFLEKVDMSKTRIEILKGLSLDLHPEQNYPHYMKLYPADPKYNAVPVPIPGNPAANY